MKKSKKRKKTHKKKIGVSVKEKRLKQKRDSLLYDPELYGSFIINSKVGPESDRLSY
jgi:hypothetical protein